MNNPIEGRSTPDLFRLDNRVVFLTGASGLIAEQFAVALSEYGAKLVLTDIQTTAAEALAECLKRDQGAQTLVLECDVTSRSSWENAVASAIATFGTIDILINNAACTNQSRTAGFSSPFQDFPLEDWNRILHVNLTGVFLGCQVVGKQMLKQEKGSIINMASLYGVVSPHHRMYEGTNISQPPAYSVSKAGVLALTRYLAALWAEKGIRVNCITPGGVFNEHTEPFLSRFSKLNPIGRMSWKEELRGAVVYLASDASSHCIGHNLVVDGGWTIW